MTSKGYVVREKGKGKRWEGSEVFFYASPYGWNGSYFSYSTRSEKAALTIGDIWLMHMGAPECHMVCCYDSELRSWLRTLDGVCSYAC